MTYSPAENWLITHDAVMARLISQNGPLAPYLRVSTDVDYFAALARSITGQQISVKGIGAWTAQMFLMFTLGRPDVFAPGDRGLQLAIQRLYNFPVTPPPKALEQLASTWSPYRTTACTHLWHSLENMPTNE